MSETNYRAMNRGTYRTLSGALAALILVILLIAVGSANAQEATQEAPQKAPEGAASPAKVPAKVPASVVTDRMPDYAIIHRSLSILRHNPSGLQHEHRLMWQMRLSDSEHRLLKNSYFALGPQVMVSPSLQRAGLRASFKPFAMLEMFALVEKLWFIGTFDYVQSYPDAAADFSPEAQKAATERGENYDATGTQISLSARLQAKVGPIAVRSTNRLNRHWFNTKRNDPVWYDIYTDTLTPRDGWVFLQDNDLLFIKGRLVIGLRHTMSRSYLSDEVLKPLAVDADRPELTHRLGPFAAYRLNDDTKFVDSIFRRPTLVVLTQFWVKHPYRTGQSVSQAIPWIVVALAFDGRVKTL